MRIITCQVNSGTGCSVWQYLKGCHGCSRRFLNRLKQGRGSLFLNGAPVESVARTLLREGDTLSLVLEEETVDFIPNAALSAPVVYEDEDLVVFNKPPGMPVHPSHRHLEDTLANLFAARCLKKGEAAGFHPINRLDRDTSGLCVVAKHALAAAALSGEVEKVYYAVAEGNVAPSDGFIKQPIARAGESIILRRVSPDGKPASTHYRVLFRQNGHSLLAVRLQTGRTHQIRVHFAFLGHPLAGDDLYGGTRGWITRQSLHCGLVRFIHPVTGERVCLKAHLPPDMTVVLRIQ